MVYLLQLKVIFSIDRIILTNFVLPFHSQMPLVILLTVCYTIHIVLVWSQLGIKSISDPLIDTFLYSHHLSAYRNIVLIL